MSSSSRRPVGHLLVAGAAVLGLVACSASRPSAAPPSTAQRVGPPATAPESTDGATSTVNSTPSTSAVVAAPTSGATTTSAAATTPPTAATSTTFPGVAATSTLVPPTEAEWAAFDAYLRDRLLDAGDFAFGVAVSIDGEPVHVAAFGNRTSPNMSLPPPESPDSDSSSALASTTSTSTTTTSTLPPDPVVPTDRFRIASISKVITGTVVLQLVDDGTLTLDDPVGPLLGEFLGVDVGGRPPAAITVRQLLSHTTGFGAYQDTFFGRGVESCREAAERGLDVGVMYDPGTTYEYSNMNFCVLTMLIEAVTGQPYEQVVQTRLLDPLGISGMRLAGTFDPNPDEVVHPSFPNRNYMEVLSGAGSWVASPTEVVRIVDSLDNDKPGFHPLPEELAALMRRPVAGIAYSRPTERWYGLAMMGFADQSWGHTGTIESTHTVVMHRPDGMTWAILVSGNYPEETDDLFGTFQDAIDQAGIDAPAPTTSTTTTTTTTTTSTTTVPGANTGGSTTSTT